MAMGCLSPTGKKNSLPSLKHFGLLNSSFIQKPDKLKLACI